MFEQEAMTALVEAAKSIFPLLATGLLLMVFSWATVEHLIGLVPAARKLSPRTKEAIASLLSLGTPYFAHRVNLVSFGSGPDGWGKALLVGFLAAGLVPPFHRWVKTKFPWLVRDAPEAEATP